MALPCCAPPTSTTAPDVVAVNSSMLARVPGPALREATEATISAYGTGVTRETAYTIGAKPTETDKPQLWVDSSTFLPVRLISYVDEGGKKVRYESRFFDYQSGAGDFFPRIIENYRAGKLVRRAEVGDIKVNQDLPETLFAVPAG